MQSTGMILNVQLFVSSITEFLHFTFFLRPLIIILYCPQEEKAHAGAKAAQAVFLRDDRIFTTGFSKMSDRQYALWAAVSIYCLLEDVPGQGHYSLEHEIYLVDYMSM